MSFAADIRHWPTPADLAAHLAAHPPTAAAWATGLTVHHTHRPLPSQWRGRATMEATLRFYRETRQWSSGPHLFVCVGAPDPAHDGIWQLTPLSEPGTHAGPANASAWGLEVVGDYTARPWSPPLRDLVVETVAALFRWRGLAPTREALRGHRDWMPRRSCPGHAIKMHDVRRWVAAELGRPA